MKNRIGAVLFAGLLASAAMKAEPSCGQTTLGGTYGYAVSGSAIIGGQIYFAAAGRIKSDGAGNLTANDTATAIGVDFQRRSYGGAY